MTHLELTGVIVGSIGIGFVLAWLMQESRVKYYIRRWDYVCSLRQKTACELLDFKRKYFFLREAASDALPHLKSIRSMQNSGLHLARTVVELDKRLAKFSAKNQLRAANGRFIKPKGKA